MRDKRGCSGRSGWVTGAVTSRDCRSLRPLVQTGKIPAGTSQEPSLATSSFCLLPGPLLMTRLPRGIRLLFLICSCELNLHFLFLGPPVFCVLVNPAVPSSAPLPAKGRKRTHSLGLWVLTTARAHSGWEHTRRLRAATAELKLQETSGPEREDSREVTAEATGGRRPAGKGQQSQHRREAETKPQ